jgi:hypothetical protein
VFTDIAADANVTDPDKTGRQLLMLRDGAMVDGYVGESQEISGSAPFGWHRDFADARQRLRDWVATSGTCLDRDRPTRHTTWPGEPATVTVEDVPITDRDKDFVQLVEDDVGRRRRAEDNFHARGSLE